MVAVMPVEMWDTCALTPERARAIGELIAEVWPKPHLTAGDRAEQQLAIGRQFADWCDRRPRAYVIVEQGRLLAHAAIVPRTVLTADGPLTLAGLSRVCTDPAARGLGLGQLVAQAALGVADSGEFPVVLFQAGQRVRAFYEKLGAVAVDNRFVNSLAEDPSADAFWDDVVMRYPATAEWPAGTVDLRGPGF